MELERLTEYLERLAPCRYAEPWDNVGLLVGDRKQSVHKILLCIDYTAAVAEEAIREKIDLVIAYHPPIFKPLKQITDRSILLNTIRNGIAIYSPHTALDVAEGGTNDVLADLLGLVDRQPLKPINPPVTQAKLVTFVPSEHVETVARALFQAGAGWIGNYSSCSFRTPGTGTFYGHQGSNPSVGQVGRLETVDEIRLETVVPIDRLATITASLRASHPYEEPAFDIVQLISPPTDKGIGRIGRLAPPRDRQILFETIKEGLGIDHLLIVGPDRGPVQTACVCAGSCGDLLDQAIHHRVDLYLTGEMRHHDAIKASEYGLTVVCTLHSHSERITLCRLCERLKQDFPDLHASLAQADRDPFRIV
ncbi:MAG: GTP cyclohydrolase 1 type 2 [Phycisphaerae bacterium]|jgi:dinuclear metal center YbgI/SA1388 family protein|nr:MAG: GTP cyclohydrolase 1 type 2 [Phycisphaerae bacterium]